MENNTQRALSFILHRPESTTREASVGFKILNRGIGFCTCGSEILAAKFLRKVKLKAFGVARRPRYCKSCGGRFKVYKGSLQECSVYKRSSQIVFGLNSIRPDSVRSGEMDESDMCGVVVVLYNCSELWTQSVYPYTQSIVHAHIQYVVEEIPLEQELEDADVAV
ncbi:hypothetical protein LR48_Vigan11g095600 [Vigna angularis]|uniref:Uncharacterized protein n=1 Tax=Phaseolus angularis TaxID=3914 RepID=A0A0L9VSJ6_PHAAN|nr:hypothetical protein LR48_Vigan11g095600 [Vigna angularis]